MAVRSPPYHRQQPAPGNQSPPRQPAGAGPPVGPDDLEPGESSQQLGQHELGSIPVLDVGRVNHYGQGQPGGVDYDVALASGYLIACVIAARPPFSVVRTDWLSKMAAPSASSGGRGMPSSLLPNQGAQCLLHPLPDALGPPFSEIPPDRAPRREVVRHHSPGYSATQHMQYAVYHLPQIGSPGMSPGCIRGQQGFQQAPLGIGQIGWICSSIHTPTLTETHREHQAILMHVYTIVTHPLTMRKWPE